MNPIPINPLKGILNQQDLIQTIQVSKSLETIPAQLEQLEQTNMSPLPTEEDKATHKSKVQKIFKRILLNVNAILLDGLKDLRQMGSTHYWSYLSSFFSQERTVRFTNSLESQLPTDKEKGFSWLAVAIHEKDLLDILKNLYKVKYETKFYQAKSLMVTEKSKILKIMDILSKFDFSVLELFLVKEFKLYIHGRIERECHDTNDLYCLNDYKENPRNVSFKPGVSTFNEQKLSPSVNNNIVMNINQVSQPNSELRGDFTININTTNTVNYIPARDPISDYNSLASKKTNFRG